MLQLPTELLARILQTVDPEYACVRLQLVCKQWRDAVAMPEAHCQLGSINRQILFQALICPRLLAVLPYGSTQRRLQVGGVKHIQLLNTQGITEWPSVFQNVTKVELTSINQLCEITPQRFPRLQNLKIYEHGGAVIRLKGFPGLQVLSIDVGHVYDDTSVDELQIPDIRHIPDDCVLNAHITMTDSLQNMVDTMLHSCFRNVRNLSVLLVTQSHISVQPLAQLHNLACIVLDLSDKGIEDFHHFSVTDFDKLNQPDAQCLIKIAEFAEAARQHDIFVHITDGWQHYVENDKYIVKRRQ